MIDPDAARALANRIDYALGQHRRDTTITLNATQARLAAAALRAAAAAALPSQDPDRDRNPHEA